MVIRQKSEIFKLALALENFKRLFYDLNTMLNKLIFSLTFLSLLVAPAVFSQGKPEQGQDLPPKGNDQAQTDTPVDEEGEMQGEEKKLDFKVTEGEPPVEGEEENEDITPPGRRGVQSDKGLQGIMEHGSKVAQYVQSLLKDPDLEGGIGEQVSEFARAQDQAQEQIQEHVRAIESRGQIMRFFFGSDQQAVKGLEKQLRENRDRLAKLEELENQAPTEDIQAKIRGAKTVLEEQSQALEQAVEAEKQIRGIFGRLLSLFQ